MKNRDRQTTKGPFNRVLVPFLFAAIALGVTACEGSKAVYPERDKLTGKRVFRDPQASTSQGGLFGEGGLNLFGGDKEAEAGATGVGVNSYLWRASLDTIAFMPLTSADPFGGVIITDWYSPPESPNERFKTNVYILAKALRADGVKVSVFRQTRDAEGAWVEAPVANNVVTDMENAILTRARQLRLAVLTGE
jgi:hypothetical protein